MSLPQSSIKELRKLVGPKNVLTRKEDLIPYSFDGTAALNQMPGAVVLTKTNKQIQDVLKLANDQKIPIVTRGSGTGLSGGAMLPSCTRAR